MYAHNNIVGKPETENSVATLVKRVQSSLPTLISVSTNDWATWFHIGSRFLQCPHHGA